MTAATNQPPSKPNQDSKRQEPSTNLVDVVNVFKNVFLLNVQPIGTYTGQLHTVFSALDDPQMREVLKFTLLSGIISELGSFYLVPKEATVTSVKSSFLNDINHLVIKITYTLDNKEEEVCVELEQRNMILTNVDTLQSILNAYVVPCEIAPKTQQKYSLLKRD